jgi:glycosyltransferase involved in cell wall biosynthesis
VSIGSEVLLVGHDASRTGAPELALSWLRWAVEIAGLPVRVVLLRGGPLEAAFAALAPTSTPGRLAAAEPVLGARSHRPRLAWEARQFRGEPLVVANTLAAWEPAATVRHRSALVCWVHELDGVAEQLVARSRRAALIAQTDRYVAIGRHVQAMLIDRWGIDPGRVTVVDSFTGPPDDAAAPRSGPGRGLRILGAGSVVPRKGVDAFVSTIANLDRPLGPGEAAWVGGPLDGPFAQLVRCDRAAAGLDATLLLPGPVPSVAPWWPLDGVVLHPAREDPSPLVVLEASQRAIPVVTWESGGAADLVEAAGLGELVAPYGDLLGLAERVDALLADPDRRRAAGRAMQLAAVDRTVAVGAPAVWAAMAGRRAEPRS